MNKKESTLIFFLIIFFGGIIVISSLYIFSISFIFGLTIFISAVFGYYYLISTYYKKTQKEYADWFKDSVVSNLNLSDINTLVSLKGLEGIDTEYKTGISYDANQGFSLEELKSIPGFSDYIFGEYDNHGLGKHYYGTNYTYILLEEGHALRIAKVFLEHEEEVIRREYDSNTKQYYTYIEYVWKTDYDGYIGCFDNPEGFYESEICISTKNFWDFSKKIGKIGHLNEFKSAFGEIRKEFNIQVQDGLKGATILKPKMMEGLKIIKEKIFSNFLLYFYENKIWFQPENEFSLGIEEDIYFSNSTKDLLYPGSFVSPIDHEQHLIKKIEKIRSKRAKLINNRLNQWLTSTNRLRDLSKALKIKDIF